MSRYPFFRIAWPPTLVARQMGSALFYAYLTRWRYFGAWLLRHGAECLPVAAGARGMGCIGYPDHVVWEVTSRCNLSCVHCHVGAGDPVANELDLREGMRLIDGLREVREFRMLVYTGGEPLVRGDIFELLEYSRRRGFINVLATNGTLLDDAAARDLKRRGVAAVAVSLDSGRDEVHNRIRCDGVAFSGAVEGIKAARRAGITVQINITAMEYNLAGLDELIELTREFDPAILLVYQLIPVGRGHEIRDAALESHQSRELLEFLVRAQERATAVMEPAGGPQYWAYLMERRGLKGRFWRAMARPFFHGCTAGRGFAYLKPDGEVWACPFIERSAGSVRRESFAKIWRHAELFAQLRRREELLKGKCGLCEYRGICGGCRGRALALGGDLLGEDPTCFI
ncbi:MAG: radical SAM protein [Candidatus Aureabacteria bacterium]|nr:radical SAM protein [Candidatus Auribacterota bacterium]